MYRHLFMQNDFTHARAWTFTNAQVKIYIFELSILSSSLSSSSFSSSSSWSPKSPLYSGCLFTFRLNSKQGLPRAGMVAGAGAWSRGPARGVSGMSRASAGAAAAVEVVGDGAGGESTAGTAGGDFGVKSDLLNQIELSSSSSKRSVTARVVNRK